MSQAWLDPLMACVLNAAVKLNLAAIVVNTPHVPLVASGYIMLFGHIHGVVMLHEHEKFHCQLAQGLGAVHAAVQVVSGAPVAPE